MIVGEDQEDIHFRNVDFLYLIYYGQAPLQCAPDDLINAQQM